MRTKKTEKGKSETSTKAAVAEEKKKVTRKKKVQKSEKSDPVVSAPKRTRTKKATVADEPVVKKETKKRVKSSDGKSETKVVKKTKKSAEPKKRSSKEKPIALDMTMSIAVPSVSTVEPAVPVQNIVDKKSRKSSGKGRRKKSKKEKILVDNDNQSGIVQPESKVGKKGRRKKNQVEAEVGIDHDDDDDFKEGKKRKRRKSNKKKASDFAVECPFKDSIDVIGGDAREAFNTHDGTEDYVWCVKRECRIFKNICGRYVKPACWNKIRCVHYDYGMTIKSKFNLKTVEDPKKETKKKKGGDTGEEDYSEGFETNDNLDI